MDSLFGSVMQQGLLPSGSLALGGSPDIELNETDEDYQVVIDVPENGELELSTDIEDNAVKIAGTINYSATDHAQGKGMITPSSLPSPRPDRQNL